MQVPLWGNAHGGISPWGISPWRLSWGSSMEFKQRTRVSTEDKSFNRLQRSQPRTIVQQATVVSTEGDGMQVGVCLYSTLCALWLYSLTSQHISSRRLLNPCTARCEARGCLFFFCPHSQSSATYPIGPRAGFHWILSEEEVWRKLQCEKAWCAL